MKVRRSVYNLIFGFGNQIIIIALSIIIPRLFLLNFGSEVNGLVASINQVFVYMALLEAGVGSASVQALYKPISKNDKVGINSIMSATSIYYKKTGVYYFFSVVVFAIIYPLVIKTSMNKMSVAFIILLIGMSGVLNYFFQGKYRLLLTAEGKGYVNTLIGTIVSILTSVMKIILLLIGCNIIVIQVSYLVITIFQILLIKWYISKNYKWIDLTVKPDYEAISQKNSVLVHQISYLIFQNTDVLILTIFCGLKVVSVYVMYNLFFSMIDTAIGIFDSSITFALGHTYHEDREKYLKFFDVYELYYMGVVFSLFVIALMLIIPFMRLYTAGIKDINYIDYIIPILFISCKLLNCARYPSLNAITIAGHFKKTQNRAILEASINIIFSLILVNKLGVYGVLIGTIIALIYRSLDMIIYANKKLLNRSPWITAKRLLISVVLLLIIVFVNHVINLSLTSYGAIIICGAIMTITILPLFFIILSIFERKASKFAIDFVKDNLSRFIHRKHLK